MRQIVLLAVLIVGCEKSDELTIVNQSYAPSADVKPTVEPAEEGFTPKPPEVRRDSLLSRCATSKECGEQRACIAGKSGCEQVPKSEPDPCKVPCDELGLCVHTPDGCRAQSAEHCRASVACRENGQCAMFHGECVATSDFDCNLGNNCASLGHCTASAGICRAYRDGDCDAVCKSFGRCQRLNDSCAVVTDADCAGPCAYDGRCKAVGSSQNAEAAFDGGACVWPQDASCKDTEICRTDGRCEFRRRPSTQPGGAPIEQCVVTDTSCAASKLCRSQGLCVKKDDRSCKRADADATP